MREWLKGVFHKSDTLHQKKNKKNDQFCYFLMYFLSITGIHLLYIN